MSILFALAIATTTTAAQPAQAAPVDHSKHAKHMQEMQKHHEQCRDMMAKMHQGMKHDGHNKPDHAQPEAER